VAQWEREAIGERTSIALQHKKSKGEYTGGKIPFGYKLDKDGIKLLVEEKEQAIIKLANKLRKEGLSLRKVGSRLEAKGLLPRNGGKWHAKTVKAICL